MVLAAAVSSIRCRGIGPPQGDVARVTETHTSVCVITHPARWNRFQQSTGCSCRRWWRLSQHRGWSRAAAHDQGTDSAPLFRIELGTTCAQNIAAICITRACVPQPNILRWPQYDSQTSHLAWSWIEWHVSWKYHTRRPTIASPITVGAITN